MNEMTFGKRDHSNVVDIHRTSRERQLAEIAIACTRLEQRQCKCGCSLKFKVFPESDLVYGSFECAKSQRYRFEPAFQHGRQWVKRPVAGITAPVAV